MPSPMDSWCHLSVDITRPQRGLWAPQGVPIGHSPSNRPPKVCWPVEVMSPVGTVVQLGVAR